MTAAKVVSTQDLPARTKVAMTLTDALAAVELLGSSGLGRTASQWARAALGSKSSEDEIRTARNAFMRKAKQDLGIKDI